MKPIAFVTGASRGIGRATSVALAERGFDVAIAARTQKEGSGRARSSTIHDPREVPLSGSLEDTAARIEQAGGRALPLYLDLLDPDSINTAADALLAQWSRIDLLVNNAIYQGPGRMDRLVDLPLEELERILSANVVAQLRLTMRLLPRMIEQGEATVINLTSAAGQGDPPGPAGEGGWGFAYAASKAAFHRLAGILRVEHASNGIRTFNVDPGYTPTEAMRALRGTSTDLDKRFPGAPPEVAARVIAWLATSPDATAWEGETVPAQRLCRELDLLPGWPPPRRAPV